MDVFLIRHGATAGNREKRYVGRTDEPLCPEGRQGLIIAEGYGGVQMTYTSPMLRCIQTADLLFPDTPKIIVDDLRECDFGDFEYQNYLELQDNPDYQKWIDSGGRIPFPNGESREQFQNRCADAFGKVLSDAFQKKYEKIAFVVHGGTVMSILDRFASDGGSYYDYQVKNGDGFLVQAKPSCGKTEHMVDFEISICYSIKQGKYL